MGILRGYARVSTEEQGTDAQIDELRAAGCTAFYEEHGSGVSRARPKLAELLQDVRRGDILVVVRLDRLARSVRHLLETIDRLEDEGAHFRSLRDPIDTSTAQGMFSLQVLGAVAQLERALISERTKAGLKASRARGRIGGNPGLRAGDAKAIRKVAAARDRTYVGKLLAGLDMWLPTVVRMRPAHPWDEVVRALNSRAGGEWNVERLRRSVKRLVGEGMAPARLLERAPVRSAEDRLLMLVAGIALADPGKTLQQIGAQLEAMHQRAPRGGVRWSPSSVKNLLDRAMRHRLIPAAKAQADT